MLYYLKLMNVNYLCRKKIINSTIPKEHSINQIYESDLKIMHFLIYDHIL
jgi:hypothetical protein